MPTGTDQDDPGVRVGKFRNPLTAAATGRAILDIVVATHDDDGAYRFAASRDHGCDRVPFGTAAFGVRRVFDVAADVHIALFIEQRGTHVVVRILAIGLLSHGERCVDEILFVQVAVPLATVVCASGCSGAWSNSPSRSGYPDRYADRHRRQDGAWKCSHRPGTRSRTGCSRRIPRR